MGLFIKYIFTIIVTVALAGCVKSNEELAIAHFNEANKAVVMLKNNSNSYTDAYKHYNHAINNLSEIEKKYNSTNVSYDIYSTKSKIAGFSYEELLKLEKEIKLLYEAENSKKKLKSFVADELFDLAKHGDGDPKDPDYYYYLIEAYDELAEYYSTKHDKEILNEIINMRDVNVDYYEDLFLSTAFFSVPLSMYGLKFKLSLERNREVYNTINMILYERGDYPGFLRFLEKNKNVDYLLSDEILSRISNAIKINKNLEWYRASLAIDILTNLVINNWKYKNKVNFQPLLKKAENLLPYVSKDTKNDYKHLIAIAYKALGIKDKYQALMKEITLPVNFSDKNTKLAEGYLSHFDNQMAAKMLTGYQEQDFCKYNYNAARFMDIAISIGEIEAAKRVIKQLECDSSGSNASFDKLYELVKNHYLLKNAEKSDLYLNEMLRLTKLKANFASVQDTVKITEFLISFDRIPEAKQFYELGMKSINLRIAKPNLNVKQKLHAITDWLKLINIFPSSELNNVQLSNFESEILRVLRPISEIVH